MRPALGLAALALGALALRPQLVGVGPLLGRIGADLSISHAVAGLLGTIPVLCMGLFAVPATRVSARLGTRTAMGAALGAIAVFGVARALAPGAVLVLALTFPVGVGMGLAGALMPIAVKERFPHRPALATGVYTTGIQLGSLASAAGAVPLARAGSWRLALAVFSLATFGAAAGWLALSPRRPGGAAPQPVAATRLRAAAAEPVVWALVGVFGLMSVIYYGLVAWLPEAYVERGWSDGAAGALVAGYALAQVPGGLVVGWLSDRHGTRRPFLLLTAALVTVSTFGLAAVPGAAWAWVFLGGAGLGALFPLVLTLPLDLGRRPGESGAVAGVMLGAGYGLAAVAPSLLGVLRDATGSFVAGLWVLAGAAAVLVASCAPLGPRRLRPRSGLEVAAS